MLAHWSVDAALSRSVVETLTALSEGGYDTLLVSAAEVPGPLGRECTWAPGAPPLPRSTTLLRRANVGYDFGSWAAALDSYPGVRRAARALLVNDSVLGPIAPLDPVLADFEACSTPVWGLVGSNQHRPHLQTFLVGFKDGVLDSAALRSFWTGVRVETRKSKVIRYGELGLAEALDAAGIRWSAMLPPRPDGPDNPTLQGAEELLEAGIPFVKANWPRSPEVAERLRREGWLSPDSPTPDLPGSGGLLARARSTLDIEGTRGLVRAAVGGPAPGRRRARRIVHEAVSRRLPLQPNHVHHSGDHRP